MTALDTLIAIKVELRIEQEKTLAKHGLSLKKFIDLETELEQDIAPDFKTQVGEYEVMVEESPTYLWTVIEEKDGYQICKRKQMGTTKKIKLHKIK